jgi:uncharacterized protein (TIRG00374 family)
MDEGIKYWLGPENKENRDKTLRWFKLILVVVLLAGLFIFIPFNQVIKVIGNADLLLISIGILLGFPVLYLDTIQLWLLIRNRGITLSIRELFRINLAVKFYTVISPAAIVGTGYRWYKLSANGKSAEALSALAINRLLDIFIVVVMGAFWVATVGVSEGMVNGYLLVGFLIATVAGWILVTRLSGAIARWMESWRMVQAGPAVVKSILMYIIRIFKSLAAFSELTISEILLMIAVRIASEIINTVAYVLTARAVAITVSLAHLGWMRSVLMLATVTPLAVAGGLGIREASTVLVFSLFGVSADLALSFSLLNYVRLLFLSLTGGLAELVGTIIANIKKKNPDARVSGT